MTRHDLLAETLISTTDARGRSTQRTLPGVLAALGAGEVDDFPALRAHQQHAWHAFLCQLAAMGLHRAGLDNPRQDEATWMRLLLSLSEGVAEAWCLFVEDLSQPAFLQTPVTEGRWKSDYEKNESSPHPDDFGIIVLARAHDVKPSRMRQPLPEHWVYALVMLQTMSGYPGRGSFGIARMNGGNGSRAGVALRPADQVSAAWSRDVSVLCRQRDRLSEGFGFHASAGLALLWLQAWDGSVGNETFAELDPYVVEISRRVRLRVGAASELRLFRANSEGTRLDAKASKGRLGDPWLPFDDDKALTLAENGWTYGKLKELLIDRTLLPGIAGEYQSDERGKSLTLVADVVVRGQGKTGGHHERRLVLPPKVVNVLADPDARGRLAKRARDWIEHNATVRNKVLKFALAWFLQPNAAKPKFDVKEPERYVDAFERTVDDAFFPLLWASLDEADDAVAEKAFIEQILSFARAEFERGCESLPSSAARRFKARAVAESAFQGAARKHFPVVFARPSDPPASTMPGGTQ